MVKILKCYLIPKKSYDTLFKGAIFFGQSSISKFATVYLGRHFQRKSRAATHAPTPLTANAYFINTSLRGAIYPAIIFAIFSLINWKS